MDSIIITQTCDANCLIWNIAMIIIIVGALGGIVSVALEKDVDDTLWKNKTGLLFKALLGICAAALVPLLLYLTQSKMLETLAKAPTTTDYLVFASFCLAAALTAKKFISTVSDRFQHQLDETTKTANHADATAKVAKADASDADKKGDQALALTSANIRGAIMPPREAGKQTRMSLLSTRTNLTNDVDPEDLNKGKYGGKREVNNRRLDATVEQSGDEWYNVKMSVVSTDSRKPLTGTVTFVLHETFQNPKQVVNVVDGVAKLSVFAWGAFTIGAITDDGQTKLELDLSKDIDAPQKFKER